ncbi:MAG: type I 3-dehydroquinate dehydratase [bacterium]|nr:type I 3-dehydroquinate dehydratase [bacterium]
MICVSLADLGFDECRTVLKEVQMAEIRLDKLNFSPGEVGEIFSLGKSLVATHRPGNISEEDRKKSLITAIEAGADFVDIEIEAGVEFKKDVIAVCRRKKCRVIISYHNYEATPGKDELESILDKCFDDGADIAKLACQVNVTSDSARILSLYDRGKDAKKEIVAVGMGEQGKITRAAAPLLGAPFTFASISAGRETAPGQIDKITLGKILQLM